MSLDDRTLREHLDRRASTSLTDPDELAASVIAGLPASGPGSGWRRFVRVGAALGLAGAAVAVVLATQALAPRPGDGPGSSPQATRASTARASTARASDSPSPAANNASGPTLNDLAFSTNAVALSGFETADVNVTATFGGDVTEYGQMDGSLTPLVCLQKAVPAGPLDSHPSLLARTMVRADGGDSWVASFRLTAADSGRWQVTCLIAYDEAGHELNLDPALNGTSPVLDITGTHAPLLAMAFKPSPAVVGRPLEVFGHVTDEDTGDPYPGVLVTIGRDNVCAEGGAGQTVTTNENGAYSFEIREADEFPVCTWITDLPGILPSIHTKDPIAVYGMLFAHPTEP
jgi:hypothetical protein